MKLRESRFDIVTATDLRFPGGSSASTLEEVKANHASGWDTGLYHLPSYILRRPRPMHLGIAEAMLNQQCSLANLADKPITTDVLMFRHPSVVIENELPAISANHVMLVINHPPLREGGRVDYLLTYARKRIREKYGLEPIMAPIGPLVRAAVEDTYDGAIELAPEDWLNFFDTSRFFCPSRQPPGATVRIGRHSRPGREKWPSDPEEILAAYPDAPNTEVHILGGAQSPEATLGFRPKNWIVHEFGAIPAEDFLASIDAFVYFHHPDWTEAFGRVIVEAMASGLPVILPPHFEPLVGEAGIYSHPHHTTAAIDRLRDPEFYRRRSELSRRTAEERFGYRVHVERMSRFGLQPRKGPVPAERLVVEA